MRGLGLMAVLFRATVGRARPPAWVALAGLAAGAFVASGCLYSATPVSDVNPAGTSHTITARVGPPQITQEQLITIIEELVGPIQVSAPVRQDGELGAIVFQVKGGPNAGQHSTTDCQPSCFFDVDTQSSISWTYTSDGRIGRDTIRVCTIVGLLDGRGQVALAPDPSQDVDEFLLFVDGEIAYIAGQIGVTVPELFAAINSALGTNFGKAEDIFCDWVTKEWKNPNVSGLAGVFAPLAQQAQENRERANAAAAPAAAQVSPASTGQGARIVPPSTGDAGLADRSRTAWLWLTLGGNVVALGGIALLRRAVTRR